MANPTSSDTSFFDTSGNGVIITKNDPPPSSRGCIAEAKSFEAVGAYASGARYCFLPSGIWSGLNELSISAWVRRTVSLTGLVAVASNASHWNDQLTFFFGLQDVTVGTMNWSVAQVGQIVTGANDTTPSLQRLNHWHHMVGTFSASGLLGISTTYFDGALLKTVSVASTADLQNTGSWCGIGLSPYGGGANYLDGDIAFLRIYTRCLSYAEVLQLYHEPMML